MKFRLLCLLAGVACTTDVDNLPDEPPIGRAGLAILGGAAAPEHSGVVYVEHSATLERCSGALLSPQLVVTAAHCAFPRDGVSTSPLAEDGFRIGFGESTDLLDWAGVARVELPWPTEPLTVHERVARGGDIVVLVLSELAEARTYPLARGFHPTMDTRVELVGFGISSAATGESGTRLTGLSETVGWDRETGVLEVAGDTTACLGDSGGPAFDEAGHWVGVISSVSTSEEGLACGGRAFLTTLLNSDVDPWVRRMVGEPTTSVGEDGSDQDGEPEQPGGPESPQQPGEPEPLPTDDETSSPYGSCSTGHASSWAGWHWSTALVVGVLVRRSRRRRHC